MRPLTGILIGGLTIVACAIGVSWVTPRPAGWLDPAAHVVDGHWVGAEVPCDDVIGDCRVAITAAVAQLRTLEPGAVVAAVMTSHLLPYVARDGHTAIDGVTGGIGHPELVILDLADGRRRLVGLLCSPEPVSLTEPILHETTCRPGDIHAVRVGDEPWIASGG